MKEAYFFDMDGVIFDSMSNHAQAWDIVMKRHGLDFTARDCYMQEGRTGQSVIEETIWRCENRQASEKEIWDMYWEKADAFQALGGAEPMTGIHEVLAYLQSMGKKIYIVTGSGQKTLFDTLEQHFPGIFCRERMVTAFDVTKGKPAPEPYLKAWEKSGCKKEECVVIENAPLGIRSAKAAGLMAIGVNTGPLPDEELQKEGADIVLPDMYALLRYFQELNGQEDK